MERARQQPTASTRAEAAAMRAQMLCFEHVAHIHMERADSDASAVLDAHTASDATDAPSEPDTATATHIPHTTHIALHPSQQPTATATAGAAAIEVVEASRSSQLPATNTGLHANNATLEAQLAQQLPSPALAPLNSPNDPDASP